MCKAATERLLSAEARSEAADCARRQIITEAECKLQDASRALRQAELQITTAEDRATAAELRAQLAEAKAREAVDALCSWKKLFAAAFVQALQPKQIERNSLAPSSQRDGEQAIFVWPD